MYFSTILTWGIRAGPFYFMLLLPLDRITLSRLVYYSPTRKDRRGGKKGAMNLEQLHKGEKAKRYADSRLCWRCILPCSM